MNNNNLPVTPPANAVTVQPIGAGQDPHLKVPSPVFDRADGVFALASVLIGFLFYEFLLFGGTGIGAVLFFLCAYAGVLLYGVLSKRADIPRGAYLFIPVALLLFCNVYFDNRVLGFFNVVFLFLLATLHFTKMFGADNHPGTSVGWYLDLIGSFVGKPLMNADKLFLIAAKGTKDTQGKRTSRKIAFGIVLCIPVLGVVIPLLSSSDAVFEGYVRTVLAALGTRFLEYLGKGILGLITAVPLFGALYAFRHGSDKGAVRVKSRTRNPDSVAANTVLIVVNALYILYLIVQFNYVFRAFAGELPSGFIYAEYARRGFFELSAVAAVNLLLTVIIYLRASIGVRKVPVLVKTLLLGLCAITLILIAGAGAKMLLYMRVYGLTPLRVYVGWFIVLLAVTFLAVALKMLLGRFDALRVLTVFFIVWFLALNFAGTDALIARYNIQKSQQHSTVLDVPMFTRLSDAMVPYALEIARGEGDTADAACVVLSDRLDAMRSSGWQQQNWQRLRAEGVLEERLSEFYIPWEDRYEELTTDYQP